MNPQEAATTGACAGDQEDPMTATPFDPDDPIPAGDPDEPDPGDTPGAGEGPDD